MLPAGSNVFVFWSGGLDSTGLIYDYLTRGVNVDCGYVRITNNEHKSAMELQAIEKLLPIFRAFPNFHYLGVLGEVGVNECVNEDLTFKQMPIFFTYIMFMARRKYREIAFSYIMNDDMISYVEDMKNLYNAAKPFLGVDPPELSFPYQKVKKLQIWQWLPSHIIEHVVWCEEPRMVENNGDIMKNKYERCHCCASCKRHNNELGTWEMNKMAVDPVLNIEPALDMPKQLKYTKPKKLKLNKKGGRNVQKRH